MLVHIGLIVSQDLTIRSLDDATWYRVSLGWQGLRNYSKYARFSR